MTSEDRRTARYLCRKEKREARKREVLEKHSFYHVYSRNALIKAAEDATRNVWYKASVKRYMQRRIENISILSNNLIRRKDNMADIWMMLILFMRARNIWNIAWNGLGKSAVN